jgi:hypothetical protein
MFFYFIPDLVYSQLNPATVREAGLGEIFADLITTPAACQMGLQFREVHSDRGPGGKSGLLVAQAPRADEESAIGYYPDRQAWLHCGKHWLGYATDVDLPGPEAIRRRDALPGYETELGDGRVWDVPVIRRGGKYSALPQSMGIDAFGEFAMSVLPEFDPFWQASETMLNFLFHAMSLPWSEAYELAVKAISLNYRLGPYEAGVLKLITTRNYQSVYAAACDWPKVEALLGESEPATLPFEQKKSAENLKPGSTNIRPGPPADSIRIFQPAEISI